MIRVRTAYSFRSAAGKIEEVMSALKEKGYSTAPITDRASAFGWSKWSKLAAKEGMRPIFGVELAVTDQTPALVRLALDVGLAGLPLGIERVELEVEVMLGGLAGVDRAAHDFLGGTSHG